MTNQLQPHLYMICYPNSALVLSQLPPDDFGFRYNYGSASFYSGKLIFAEIDINYRHPYFQIDDALERLKPHRDGRPKATKYISSYRVLEHIDIDAIRILYIANSDGSCYPLPPGEYTPAEDDHNPRVYAELTPLSMLTLAKYNLRDFGLWFTNPENAISVPRLLYLQVNLDIDTFLHKFETNPLLPSPLEGVHPSKLRDAILDLRKRDNKFIKGITLDTAFTKESYRKIRHGFMVADQEKQKFFPMPSMIEIEKNDYRFYRGM
ncbi:MAG: hypothetical protein ACOX6O_01400 [Christensenellales bacterium]|jgi:hypothetical protein